MRIAKPFICVCMLMGLMCSCQNTNVSDLIEFRRLKGERLDSLQQEVTLKFSRTVLYYDEDDRLIEGKHELAKGSKVRLIGKRYTSIGRFKTNPDFFRENYTYDVDAYFATLPNGQRIVLELPELAIGVPGKDGRTVTDVKQKKDSNLYLYQIDGNKEWTEDPAIEYDVPEIPIYFPKRHLTDKFLSIEMDSCKRWWQKAIVAVGKPVEFLSHYDLGHLIYKDATCYLYKPIVSRSTVVARLIQAALSWLFLALIFQFLVPKMAIATVWRIRFLSNEAVVFLATILCYVYMVILGIFFQVTGWGFAIYLLMLAITIYNFSMVNISVESNRCPYCKHIGLRYDDSSEGDWHTSSSSTVRKEEKSREYREHDEYNGMGVTHVKETIHNMGNKRYTTHFRRRNHTDYYHCPACGRKIVTNWTEEHSTETSHWE